MQDTAISTLPEVKTWLETIKVGDTAAVAAAQFSAGLVTKLFALLGTDALSLTVTAVDATGDTPQLAGTATVLEQANTTAAFTFSQPGTKLLATLVLTLPSTVSWNLIASFQLGFAQLVATLTPDEELDVVGLEFAAVLQVGSGKPLNFPVNFIVPSFDGDWTLTGSFTQLGDLSQDALKLLAGNSDIVSIIPADIVQQLDKLQLKEYQMGFNPTKQTCSFIRVALQYTTDWSFFNNLFKVEGLELDFEIFDPLAPTPTYQATLLASMTLAEGIPLEVGGQLPGAALFFHLQPDKSAELSKVFTFLKIPLPSNFPDVEISTLSLVFYVEDKGFDFKLGITKAIPLAASVSLDNAFFEMGANYVPTTQKMAGFGNIHAQFTIKTTVVTLSAAYADGQGVDLVGEIDNLPIGELLDELAQRFGIPGVPGFVAGIVLSKLKVTYNTSSGNFSFYCLGTIPVAENELAIEVTLTAVRSGTEFKKDISATGILTYKDQKFTLAFDTSSTDTAFGATWQNSGTPLGINTIADMLGLGSEVPEIPEGLDLGLKEAKFQYDNNKDKNQPYFVLYAASANYGNAVMVAQKDSVTAKWLFYFGLATNQRIDLSNLPILDKLSAFDQGVLAVEAIHVDLASGPITKDTATALNDIIKKFKPQPAFAEASMLLLEGPTPTAETALYYVAAAVQTDAAYPNVPAAGMASQVAFSMQVDIGGQVIPVALGTQPAPAPLLLAQFDTLHESEVAGRYSVIQLADAASKTVWFNLQKNFGPLYFDKIGLAYKDSKIFVLLNVSATAGGLTLSLDGFGISLPIKDFDISFTISGIGITYTSGPILISGGLQGSFSPTVNLVGQVLIKTPVLSLGALGGYTEVEGKPSLFLFAVLNYPIGGPPYFFVTGLAAGFGFNRSLVIPDIGGVATFPFVQWAMGGGNPPSSLPGAKVEDQINGALQIIIDKGVVAPAVGSSWLAAGLRFTSFEILDSFALLTVAFGTEFELALLGLSRIVLPPAANKAGSGIPVVVYAELALKAAYSQKTGLIGIQGQLTSNSYVLSPDCHLTGGFAFFMWVSGDHAGEFVVTLGGYNTHFSPPTYYPVVPRLGMNWQVTPQLSIKGGEYFALTSNAVMAGGYLEAVWQSGGIRAWFSVQADFLVMWKPFHYDITASVSIGASFSIDLWFTTLHLTIHVGASLHIWGPNFTGVATIDLDIISFTISFGDTDGSKQQTIAWDDFARDMLPQKPVDPAGRARLRTAALDGTSPPPPNPDVAKLVVTRGLLKQLSDTEGDLNWIVNGEQFALTTQGVIPSKDWVFSSNLTLDPNDPANSAPQNTDFGIRPTGTASGDITSTHRLTITSTEDSTFHAGKNLGKVAKGLWEKVAFDRNGNPILGDPLNGTTLDNVLTGFRIVPFVPEPRHSLPIDLEFLQFTIDPNLQQFSWSTPYVPTGSDFAGNTVADTISSALAVHNRGLLVQAIQANGLAVDGSIDVTPLANASTSYLLAEPVMCLLGEEK